MAWRETLTAASGRVRITNGTTQQGQVKTKNISIGTLNPNTWDVDKFGAIVAAIDDIFTTSVYDAQSVRTYDVEQTS